MSNKLQLIIEETGLEKSKTELLLSKFTGYFQEAKTIAQEAKGITVTDENDTETMQRAREARLELKSIRIDAEKTRKELKEQSLREGRAIDGIANVIKALVVPVEKHLEEQEKYAERLEAQRKLNVEKERVNRLSKYVEDVEVYSLHPDKLSTDSFNKLLETSEVAYKAQKKAEEEAEQERLAKEEAERKEQERIRKENEKLKAEAEAKEKALAKERAEQEKKLQAERAKIEAERQKREAIEAKIKAQKEAEEKRKKAELEAGRQKQLAPDKDKLIELANRLDTFDIPAVKSSTARESVTHVENELKKLAEYIRNKKL
jgi:hypothetical protein